MIENNLEMRLAKLEDELAELKTMYRLSLNSLETSSKVVDLLLQRANATDEMIAELKAQKAPASAPFVAFESSPPITNDAQLEQRRQHMEGQLEQRRQQMEAQLEQRRQQAEAQMQQQRQQMEAQFERQRHELERLAQRAKA
ncbi:MAG: hypothetical protein HOP19_21345 [Acidobacteria bacterium]|nr:hypothetical protein [Acidobacteriota bacterium]